MLKKIAHVSIILVALIIIPGCGGGGGGGYTIGGTITGLVGTLILQNNGGDDYSASADGSFTFATSIADGESYTVTVKTQPDGQTCNITNAAGTVAGENIESVIVACHDGSLFSVGGTVNDLSGTVVLQNNGGDDLSVTTSGSFTFITALADGSTYDVTVGTQPSGQVCYVSNGSGIISSASVTDISVSCFTSGSLDASFSEDGIVRFDGGYDDVGLAITTDTQGRILVTGYISDEDTPGQGRDMAIWRYNSDGTLDTTFGGDGYVTYHHGYRYDEGYAIVTDDSDWVTACGIVNPSGSSINMAIWRYRSDGVADSTFDSDGVVVYTDTDSDICSKIAYDDSYRIYASGSVASNMILWRYLEDGSLDTSFGSGGTVENSSGNNTFTKYKFVFDSGDNMNITGDSGSSGMTIWRYGPNGSASSNFGNSGVATYTGSGDEMSYDIALDSSEYIYTTGYIQPSGQSIYSMGIWKYTPGGDLDTSFGSSGVAVYSGGSSQTQAMGIVVDSSGRLVTAGYDGTENDLFLWRYDSTGTIDTGFDGDGVVVFDGGAEDAANGIVLDSEGRILVTGFTSNGSTKDMVILRYHP